MKNSKQHNLLFIDDSETEISFIQLLIEIEKLPIIAHFERTAQEGLEYLKSLTQDTYPAVVIVDINMPLMNGFEFAQAFEKKIAALAPNTKLFILSSTLRLSEIQKAKKMNIVCDFLEKPFSKEHFFDKILPKLTK